MAGRKRTKANGPPFLQLYRHVFDSASYRALKPGPRALLNELIRRHDGYNNGHIGFGLREACDALNMTGEAVTGYFRKLEAHGLIRCRRKGGFNMKDRSLQIASEWSLTFYPVGNVRPTNEFMAWGSVPRSGTSGPIGAENPALATFIKTRYREIGAEILPLKAANR